MKQLVVLDYAEGDVKIIDMSPALVTKYANDYDEYVYGVLDFNTSNTNYMIVDGNVKINYNPL
ncbi:MAG: hypothetical protein IKQ37_03835 [Bacteroidaceae bacterium]|nr:hypothetical protein [Bacteroidaceae bacterium]